MVNQNTMRVPMSILKIAVFIFVSLFVETLSAQNYDPRSMFNSNLILWFRSDSVTSATPPDIERWHNKQNPGTYVVANSTEKPHIIEKSSKNQLRDILLFADANDDRFLRGDNITIPHAGWDTIYKDVDQTIGFYIKIDSLPIANQAIFDCSACSGSFGRYGITIRYDQNSDSLQFLVTNQYNVGLDPVVNLRSDAWNSIYLDKWVNVVIVRYAANDSLSFYTNGNFIDGFVENNSRASGNALQSEMRFSECASAGTQQIFGYLPEFFYATRAVTQAGIDSLQNYFYLYYEQSARRRGLARNIVW